MERTTHTRQTEPRLNLRLSLEKKQVIENAASLSGQTVNAYASAVLEECSRKVVNETAHRLLTDRDRVRFLKILDKSKPTPTLKRAAKLFRKNCQIRKAAC